MQSLELKIPPPAVALLIASIMWGISLVTPLLDLSTFLRVTTAVTIALAGMGVGLAGIIAFRRARTTVNPMKPENTSSLVYSGIYKATRNPMYVGVLFVLVAWAVFLSSVWALLGPVAFVLYITRFQIEPEERVLLRMFPTEYAAYKAKVRRWL